jgi:hypothetical protein
MRQRGRMSRRPTHSAPTSAHHPDYVAAAALRPRLEQARLDLRALFRALDQLHLAQDLPDELHSLFELDADFAESLCVLDQPARPLNWTAMRQDTLASLADLEPAQTDLLDLLPRAARRQVAARRELIRSALRPGDAYLEIPTRDPQAR